MLKSGNSTESVIAQNRSIRHRRQSTMLNNSAVEQTLAERSELTGKLKSAFYETIDIVTIEMTNPFEKNDAIVTAIDTAEKSLSIKLPNEIELQIAKNEIHAENDKLNDLKKPGDVKTDQTLFHSLAHVIAAL